MSISRDEPLISSSGLRCFSPVFPLFLNLSDEHDSSGTALDASPRKVSSLVNQNVFPGSPIATLDATEAAVLEKRTVIDDDIEWVDMPAEQFVADTKVQSQVHKGTTTCQPPSEKADPNRADDSQERGDCFRDSAKGEEITCLQHPGDLFVEKKQGLFRPEALAQATLHSIADAVITTDNSGRVDYLNPAAEKLIGWDLAEVGGYPLADVFHLVDERTRQPVENPIVRVLREESVTGMPNHTLLVSRDGTEYSIEDSAAPIRNSHGQMIGAVMVFHDVTQSRQLANQLSWQASHDALTGLTNRRRFEQDLADVLQDAQQEGHLHVLCYLDLDQFKVVNDTCGHTVGDELLRQVSRLLRGQVRAADTLSRLGGDEFGVLLRSCSLQHAEIIAEKLRMAVKDFQFVWQNQTFAIGVSIGIVPIDRDSRALSEVLSQADAACYAAKNGGRNRIHIYRANDSDLAKQRREQQWSVRIRQAIADNRFCLYRQEIAHTTTQDDAAHIHYEVLLRMIGEQDELILPGVFIPAAERYGLMPAVDRWVVQNFFVYLEQLLKQTPAPTNSETQTEKQPDSLHLINLSGASIADAHFLDFLKEQFIRCSIPPQMIGFEITETAAIANLQQTTHFIRELKQLGCAFALDDFGSGLSSFGYLKNLPIDYLKIDGKFIEDITVDPTACAIVESINRIGHVMSLKTIAESVENLHLRDRLCRMGVDYVQGYSISYPCRILETG